MLGRHAETARAVAWVLLVVVEALVVSVLFDLDTGLSRYRNPIFWGLSIARWSVATAPVLALLLWPERQRLAERWMQLRQGHDARRALALNLALFLLVAMATQAFTSFARSQPTPPWTLFAVYSVLLAANVVSLLHVVMPLRAWRHLAWECRRPLLVSGLCGAVMMALTEASLLLWDKLAGATLGLTAAMLGFWSSQIVVDPVARSIGLGNFTVVIFDSCSGYEGLALVAVFVSLQLWLLRAQLRFPAALVLYPVGLGAIWLLNSLRIAALLVIGARFSPEMAAKGFHSQAGWIAFLLVAIALMALPRRFGLLRPAGTAPAKRATPRPIQPTSAYLAPFIALMLGSVAMAATAPLDRPVYILKATAVAGALWACRNSLRAWWPTLSALPIAAGVVVGFAWIATAPGRDAGVGLGTWLADIGPVAALLWLLVRGVGTVLLVPAAEEIAFRGYLYRRLIAADFAHVRFTHQSAVALIVSSVLFGLLHDRWLAATISGIVFAVLMLRNGRPGDAVLSHATANAVIFAWALAFRHWSLL